MEIDAYVVVGGSVSLVFVVDTVEGRKFASGGDRLDIVEEVQEVAVSDISGIEEGRPYLGAAYVAVGVRSCINVADMLDTVVVLESKVVDVEVAQKISACNLHEICVQFSGNLGCTAPGVEVESLEVGVSYIGGEFVKCILRLGRQVEYPLENEVEVGVSADDLSVESVVGICSCSGYSCIIISKQGQPVHDQGVGLHIYSVVSEYRPEAGVCCDFADEILVDDPAYIQILCLQGTFDTGVLACRACIFDGQHGIRRSRACLQFCIGGEFAQRALHRSVQFNRLILGEIAEIQLFAQHPARHGTGSRSSEPDGIDLSVDYPVRCDGDAGNAQ